MNFQNSDKFFSYLVSILILLLVTPILIESFGTSLLYVNEKPAFENEARVMFFLCSTLGQIVFSLLTKIQGGFLMLPLLEISKQTRTISTICNEEGQNGLKNTLACLFIACLMSSLLGFVLYLTKTTKYLTKIPRNINDSVMITIGLFNIFASFKKIAFLEDYSVNVALKAFSVLITFFGVLIFYITKNPFYIFYYLLSLICLLNFAKFGWSIENLVKYKIFSCKMAEPLRLASIFEPIFSESAEFDFQIIRKNAKNILVIASIPLLSQIISLFVYSRKFEECFSIERELFNVSLANLLSAFSFFPTHFSCSGSIFFRLAGAKSKYHSLFSGISLVILYYTFHLILPFIPVFSVSFVLQFIGLTTLLTYSKTILNSSFIDKVQLVLICAVCIYAEMNMILVVITGVLINCAVNYLFSSQTIGSIDIKYQTIENVTYVKIEGNLDFISIYKLLNGISNIKNNIVISLEECKYIDYTANIELEKFLGEFGFKVDFQGSCKNFNSGILLKHKQKSL